MSKNNEEVRDFDNSRFVRLPEYRKFQAALNDLALAVDRMEDKVERGGVGVFVEAVANAARTSYAAEMCRKRDGGCDTHMNWPYAVKVNEKGTAMWCEYFSLKCGHEWYTNYSTHMPSLI